MRIDRGFADLVLKSALDRGADLAEVYLRKSRTLRAESREAQVHALEHSSGFAYSLKVIRDGKLGFSYANDPDEITDVAGRAIESLDFTEEDRFLDVPSPEGDYPDVLTFDPDIDSMGADKATEYAIGIENAAYDYDPRVRKTRKSSATFTSYDLFVLNSKGLSFGYGATSASATITAVAEGKGDSQMGWGYDGGRFLRDIDFIRAGREGARRACAMLGARRAAPGKVSLVIDSPVAVDFLSVASSMMSADSVQKKKSLLDGKMGRTIMSKSVNIIDNPLIYGSPASKPMDGEGVRCRENTLVSEGVLMSYMHNTYTANKAGDITTANAIRGGAFTLPGVGPQCIALEPASKAVSVEEMISSIDSGVLIMDAMGVHTINPVSGDFSIGVSGLSIKKGKPSAPVKEAVISGNILDFLGSIEAVGNDMRFFGSFGSPSLLVTGVDLSA